MIHSLSGGELKNNKVYDFAKVKIIEGEHEGEICFYISNLSNLKINDLVLVPIGFPSKNAKSKVLRIDKNINEQMAPFPIKKMKSILKIIKEDE